MPYLYIHMYIIYIHTKYVYFILIGIFYIDIAYMYNTENLVFFLPSISFLSMYMQVIFSLKGKVCPSNSLNLS